MSTPWPYSVQGDPASGVPNLPCEAGAELGREVARLTETARLQLVQQNRTVRPMCNECAFREGTYPNRCAATVMDAIKCLVEGEMFYCHKGIADDADPKVPCAGYLIARTDGAMTATP